MALWLRFKPSTNTLLSSRVTSCSLNLIGIACPNYALLTGNWFSPPGVLLIRRLGNTDAILPTTDTSVRTRIEARGPYSKRKYVLSSDKTYCSSGIIGAYKLADKSNLPLAGISWRHPSMEPYVTPTHIRDFTIVDCRLNSSPQWKFCYMKMDSKIFLYANVPDN